MSNVVAEYFWGLTLQGENSSDTFSPRDEMDFKCCAGIHNILVLKQALLDPKATENEINVVQVETTGWKYNFEKTPVAVLNSGRPYANLDLMFTRPPLTFTLIKGNGPVHLAGHYHKYHSLILCDVFGNSELWQESDLVDEIVQPPSPPPTLKGRGQG